MLYADKITLLPNAGRDTEWKQLQRVAGNKVDHADLRTLTIYDDNRADLQGEVTGLLSGLL